MEEDLIGLNDSTFDKPRSKPKQQLQNSLGDLASLSFSMGKVPLAEGARSEDDRRPEEDDNSDSSSRGSRDSRGTASQPDGFAFPVTKKIIHFLNRFSTAPDELQQASFNRSTNISSQGVESTGESKSQFSYAQLVQMLKHPRAADVYSSIKTFLDRFLAEQEVCRISAEEVNVIDLEKVQWDGERMPGEGNADAQQVQGFLRSLERQVRLHPMWRKFTEEDWEKTVEGLEKLVMCRIENRVFQPSNLHKALDAKLKKKIQSLSFLRAEHLEVRRTSPELLPLWQQAGEELCKVNKFRSPRDKLVCIQNCSKLIINILRSDGDALNVGADEFVPALIFVVLKTNPDNLHSNIDYIAAFRNPSKLAGEAGYYFTQLTMAVSFIQSITPNLLSIDEASFHNGVRLCLSRMEHDPTFSFGWMGWDKESETHAKQSDAKQSGEDNPSTPSENHDDDETESMGAAGLETGEPKMFASRQEFEAWKKDRFRFLHRNANELQLGEIEHLLAEYKTLAQTVERLAACSMDR